MYQPQSGDYIDIHTHGGKPSEGVFCVESLLAHEGIHPWKIKGMGFTAGIHPWFLNEENHKLLMEFIKDVAGKADLLAIGEAGFDKLRGPSFELQRKVFEEQVRLSMDMTKPVVIHCVKAWDELFSSHKYLKPRLPWLVHGFRGKKELADQLLKRGMYISPWFDFAIRPESAELLRSLPLNRIFLETDGADIPIQEIYRKVASDLKISVEKLIGIIHVNFRELFK